MQIPFYVEIGLLLTILGALLAAWFLGLFIVMDLKKWIDKKGKNDARF